jgi:hypothetical protein
MPFTTSPANGCPERVEERQDAPDMPPGRRTDHQVDFYLIHLTVDMPGFTMRWTSPPLAPTSGDHHRGSDLRVIEEFSTVHTYGTASGAVQWERI